jgi:hypothetical protein
MIGHPEIDPLIVVAVDFKFKQFDFDRFELGYFKNYCQVNILDLSSLASYSFRSAISAAKYDGDNIFSISTYKQLYLELERLAEINIQREIIIMNFVKPTSFPSLLFLGLVKKAGIKTVDYFNAGVPSVASGTVNLTALHIVKGLKRRLFYAASKVLKVSPTHRMVAGNYWIDRCQDEKISKVIRIHKANTWDYSNFILKGNKKSSVVINESKTAVLLDGAGPMFSSDDANIGKKTYMTSEEWYPSLVVFFECLEKLTGVTVEIAAHPKSAHDLNPPYFGCRNVKYRKTLEMVSNADFIITRGSTAISYAVLHKKPVIFIYSDQLKDDRLAMAGIKMMAEELGTSPVNINNELSLSEFSKHLVVDHQCYERYKRNYLTSLSDDKSNAEILLQDILQIDTPIHE